MSPAPVLFRTVRLGDTHRADQRAYRRYPIALDLEYTLLKRGRFERSGVGKVLNISSHGVLFESDDLLPVFGRMELTIPWPFQLDDVCPLKLVLRGRIVRSDGNGIAIKTEHHEFRTSPARSSGT